MKNKLIALVAVILLLAPAVFSQSRETGAIRGVVTDEQNAPLPGVNITLTGENLMGQRTFVTDANGEFRFPALPPARISDQSRAPGIRDGHPREYPVDHHGNADRRHPAQTGGPV